MCAGLLPCPLAFLGLLNLITGSVCILWCCTECCCVAVVLCFRVFFFLFFFFFFFPMMRAWFLGGEMNQVQLLASCWFVCFVSFVFQIVIAVIVAVSLSNM